MVFTQYELYPLEGHFLAKGISQISIVYSKFYTIKIKFFEIAIEMI